MTVLFKRLTLLLGVLACLAAAPVYADCTSPAGKETVIIYTGDYHTYQGSLHESALNVRHLGRSMNGLRAGMSAAPLMAAARLGTHRADRRLRLDCRSTPGRCAHTAAAAANLCWRPEFAQCFQMSYIQSTFV